MPESEMTVVDAQPMAATAPPQGAPSLVTWTMLPQEQLDWLEQQQQLMTAQLEQIGEQSQILARSIAAAEANKASFERQAKAMEDHAAQSKELVKALNASPPRATALIVEGLCQTLASELELSPEAVVDRARAIASRYRMFYPAVSTPAPSQGT